MHFEEGGDFSVILLHVSVLFTDGERARFHDGDVVCYGVPENMKMRCSADGAIGIITLCTRSNPSL